MVGGHVTQLGQHVREWTTLHSFSHKQKETQCHQDR